MAACQPDAPAVVEADDGSSTSSIFLVPAVDAADFAPPYFPHPRPWQRVPVPAAPATLYSTGAGFRKIWKRVGVIPLSIADRHYAAAIYELRADGCGPRKRCRAEQYVPAWGDMSRKQISPEQAGRLDWELAKDSVDAVKRATTERCFLPQQRGNRRQATVTFPSDSLHYVPRKRNSRRVMLPRSTSDHCAVKPAEIDATPEAPPEERAPSPARKELEGTVGELSGPAPVPDDQPMLSDAVAEHITKRAKRRPGRRFSVSLERQSDDSAKAGTSSPKKKASVGRARKSLPARWYPLPLKRRMSASTPAPLTTLSETSIVEEQPEMDQEQSVADNSSASLLSELPTVVVFDQPTPVVGEAAYDASLLDAKRQLSMQNARRRETRNFADALGGHRRATLTGGRLAEEAAQPNRRRRSMMPLFPLNEAEKATPRREKQAKTGRRHTIHPSTTFDFHFVSLSPCVSKVGEERGPVTRLSAGRKDTASTPSKPSVPAIGSSLDSTVVVDVRTNLDIFGSGPPVQESHASSPAPAALEDAVGMSTLGTTANPDDDKKAMDSNEPSSNTSDVLAEQTNRSDPAPNAHSTIAEVASDLLDQASHGLGTPRSDDDLTSSPTSGAERPLPKLYDRVEDFDASRLVSSQPAPLELSESLLLPLSEMASTTSENESDCNSDVTLEDLWQSPSLSPVLDQDQMQLAGRVAPTNSKLEDSSSDVVFEDDTLTTSMELDAAINENGMLSAVSESIAVDDTADLDLLDPTDNDGAISSPPPPKETDTSDSDDTATDEAAEEAQHQDVFVYDDATVTMTVDINNMDEEQQYSAHDDSETEMLRKFVTRVQADKSAKAAAAAAAAAAATAASPASAAISSHPTSTTAAMARNRVHLSQKRRSGSTGSAASASGSPFSKKETAHMSANPSSPLDNLRRNRIPLGMKDHNMSPSPVKQKAKGIPGVGEKIRRGAEDLLSKPSLDDTLPPRPKRRRKKMEADTGGVFNPEFAATPLSSAGHMEPSSSEQTGLRRSKRTRVQTPLKTATSAGGTASTSGTGSNSVLSHIPIRLPGSLNLGGEDGVMLASSSRQNGMSDKDLAAVTRVNTRKNKGKAEPPCVLLARQAEESTSMANLETLSSVFDSPKHAAGSTPAENTKGKENGRSVGKQSRKVPPPKVAKTVRWAEVLARFQDSDKAPAVEPRPVVSVFKAKENTATKPEAVRNADATPVTDGNAAPEDVVDVDVNANKDGRLNTDTGNCTPATTVTPVSTSGAQQSDRNADETDATAKTETKAVSRRTARVSRLPPPTPRKDIAAAAAAAAAKALSAETQSSSKTAGSLRNASAPGTPGPRMATRRTKILSMGVSGNGTPAPRRRINRA